MRKYLLHVLIISFAFISMPVIHSAEEPHIVLRSSYSDLFVSQVQSMSNISIRKKKDWGFVVHSTISHSYNLRLISGDKVVVDSATGLMWHQNGSSEKSLAYGSSKIMRWDEAKEWVRNLNSRGYAGYHDWRLPTAEEAVSLLESSKKNGKLYIDPVFSKKQEWIWTGDRKVGWRYSSTGEINFMKDAKNAWEVNFRYGHVLWTDIGSYNCVRPVRSVK
jgi:hypothetical protein